MDQLPNAGGRYLAARLLAAHERWGWEYVAPEPLAPSPLQAQAPRWLGCAEPEPLRRDRLRAKAIPLSLGAAVLVAGFISVLAFSWGLPFWPISGVVVVAPMAAWCAMVALRYWAARGLHQTRTAEEWNRYQGAVQEWQSRVAEHEQREQARLASTVLWYPVVPEQQWTQANIFGGTMDGWSSLLSTLGMSLLSSSPQLLVLDFTERGVGTGLATLADAAGHHICVNQVPGDGVFGVEGLSAAEAGELMAGVLAEARGSKHPDAARARAVDAEVVEAVCGRLAPPWTFERIAAGLTIVRRVFDTERRPCLSHSEIRELTRATDVLGPFSDSDALRFATATLRLLSDSPHGGTSLGSFWASPGVHVVATADPHPRRKNLQDHFVFFRLLHEVRSGTVGLAGAVVVAGADNLPVAEIEALARHAGRMGIRLIVMYEHLRGEHAQLLGGANTSTVLMRLGAAAEAATAADFVGRGHRFVLSQLTEQIGHSFTGGISDTAGGSVTATVTDNYSPTSAGSSDSRSRAATWSQTSSWSWGDNTSSSRTWARAYEYTVEPTTFQSLPATAFVWVEPGGRGRRVVAGDCNPGIALLDRVAPHPRTNTAVTC
ncbi:hypothetical protein [Nocardia wallacei]|uniref:hypothetical protein n=1 Tax=Nocardia wallacei TaxID=480035 RepID=UPI002455892E|nr:hypothetical protein [Nocardia wallacei]